VEVDQVVSGVRSVVAQYTYDALDRRIDVSEAGTATWTAYDGSNPLLDFNGSGTQTARYLDGPMVDEMLGRETPSGGTSWYLTDRSASVRDVANNAGVVIDHIDYRAFGTPTETNPSAGDRFKYAEMVWDPAISQNVALERVEDPATGRWQTQDPLMFLSGDTNLYRYSDNEPISNLDYSGLDKNFIVNDWGADWDAVNLLHTIASRPYPGTAIDAANVDDAVNQILSNLSPGDTIASIQFWGHGGVGYMSVGTDKITSSSFTPGGSLAKLKPYLTANSKIIFKGCNVFRTQTGKTFAQSASNFFGVTVGGHTQFIGQWGRYPGYQELKPGQTPNWSDGPQYGSKLCKPKPKNKDPKLK
jgi:RHS repeat-associated protein